MHLYFKPHLNFVCCAQIWSDILLFALANAVGQCFIFYIMRAFSPVVLVTLTVTRKFFSILFSIVRFGHAVKITNTNWRIELFQESPNDLTRCSALHSFQNVCVQLINTSSVQNWHNSFWRSPLTAVNLVTYSFLTSISSISVFVYWIIWIGVPMAVFRHANVVWRSHCRRCFGP